MANKRVIVITGPTGVGKTDLSIEIAKELGCEIISADSRQFYREIPIGTAMPTNEQQAAVCHHFIGNMSVANDYNSGAYEADVLAKCQELFERMDDIVVVGGSGLYIDALCKGFDNLPSSPELREQLLCDLDNQGLQAMVDRLGELDPPSLGEVDLCNSRRVLRALEVSILAGKGYSTLKGGVKKRPFDVIKIVIDRPTDELYERINQRVDIMIAQGLEDEVKSVAMWRDKNSLATVGYREIFSCMDGEISMSEAIELIKRNSRRYAKRQRTWFRRDPDYVWFSPHDKEAIMSHLAHKKDN